MAARRREMRIMISTGHLGTAPSGPESFRAAIDTMPDYLVADGGSSDPGPVYLGNNSVLGQFVEDELELFLVESRKRGIPLIIGSAGDSGSNHGVDETVRQLREIAERHRIPKFRIGWFHSEVPGAAVAARIAGGERLPGLGGFPDLTAEEALAATRIVAVAGVEPFIKLLDDGCDVIVGGRCGDVCFTAAPCIRAGYPAALAYHMGKMIECASLVAEPFMGKEAIIGTISDEDILVTPFHPGQRVTVASAAGHSMYERETPFFEHMLGGVLDMRECRYEEVDGRSTRISGARFIPDDPLTVKLEGARKVGERYMGIAAIRDPQVIRHLDAAIEWSRSASARTFRGVEYELHYHVFGRDGVLKDLEPRRDAVPHEVCIVIEGLAQTDTVAHKLVDFATRMFFLARIPDSKGSSGLAACTKQTMRSSPGFVWNVNHTMTLRDPMELFPTHVAEAGV
ncbi:acyclic terpene utilization AtuA family protein [Falsiroseomonas oryziterrae]|uniref:acyclic terpene utilization AtuA family protein n=1 Tax=Falsiroseomonas oryziterrae TaxID=2911368 RepID=UPI001F2D6A6F|nr:acyclic terpene utilization AtuA family protein [Roseomonas sp. NPKOSM-4]